MQVIGKEIAPVGDQGSQGDLKLGIVQPCCDSAGQVPKKYSKSSSADTRLQEFSKPPHQIKMPRHNSGKDDLKQHSCGSIVEQTLTFDDYREPLVNLPVFEQGQH